MKNLAAAGINEEYIGDVGVVCEEQPRCSDEGKERKQRSATCLPGQNDERRCS